MERTFCVQNGIWTLNLQQQQQLLFLLPCTSQMLYPLSYCELKGWVVDNNIIGGWHNCIAQSYCVWAQRFKCIAQSHYWNTLRAINEYKLCVQRKYPEFQMDTFAQQFAHKYNEVNMRPATPYVNFTKLWGGRGITRDGKSPPNPHPSILLLITGDLKTQVWNSHFNEFFNQLID